MNSNETCPNAESLVELLDMQLPDVQQEEITEHVNSCETCQQSLESLVTFGLRGDLDFEHVGEYLRRGMAEENTLSHAAKQRLTSVFTARTTAFSDTSAPGFSLDFLEPSEHKDSLGRLGQFEITEVIGRGGMGVALKARDTRLERVVAIKVLAPELAANPTARKRFLREAQSAAAVSHDHVVTTFAVEPGKLPYLAMEYIDGQSLQQKIDREGPLQVREILRIGMQTAYGLAAAHAQGLIHRDIKPSNILLQNSVERVQITDFGLARAVDDVAITRTGEITGTPQYMSPEQAQGQTNDHRADLFSLGCVLYAMCTGRSPFRAESTMAVLNRVCNDQPRPISDINADIPGWLACIIDQLLEKNPSDRYQTAAEVADLLSQCLAHVQQPIVVPLPEMLPATNRIRSKVSHRPKWYVGVILLAVIFGSLGLSEATGVTQFSTSVISIVRGDGTLVVEVNDPGVSVTIEGEDVVITGAGPREVRLKPGEYRINAEKDGKSVPLQRRLVSISRHGRQVVTVTTVPNTAAAMRLETTVTLLRRLDGHEGGVPDVSLSAAGDLCLSGGQDRTLRLWDLSTGQTLKVVAVDSMPQSVALSPDGSTAAAALQDRVELYDTQSLAKAAVLPKTDGAPWQTIFSPDGAFLASRDFFSIHLWRIEDGSLVRRFEFERQGASVAFSPDSNAVLFVDGNLVTLHDIASGAVRWAVRCESDQVPWYVEFSPCGRFIANTVGAKLAELRSATDGKLLASFEQDVERHRDPACVAFTPDGEHLLCVNDSGRLRCWSTDSFTERFRTQLDDRPHRIYVHPDGKSAWTINELGWSEDRGIYRRKGVDYTIKQWQLPKSVWPELSPLEQEVAELQRIIDELSGDPTARRVIAETHYAIGMLYNKIGNGLSVERHLLKAIEVYDSVWRENWGHLESRIFMGELHHQLVTCRFGDVAMDRARQSLQIARDIRRDFPHEPAAIGHQIYNSNHLILSSGDTDEARLVLHESMNLAKTIDLSNDHQTRLVYGRLFVRQAEFQMKDGDYPAAERSARHAIDIIGSFAVPGDVAYDSARRSVARATVVLRRTLVGLGRVEEGIAAQQEAINLFESLRAETPENEGLEREVRRALAGMDDLLKQQAAGEENQGTGVPAPK